MTGGTGFPLLKYLRHPLDSSAPVTKSFITLYCELTGGLCAEIVKCRGQFQTVATFQGQVRHPFGMINDNLFSVQVSQHPMQESSLAGVEVTESIDNQG